MENNFSKYDSFIESEYDLTIFDILIIVCALFVVSGLSVFFTQTNEQKENLENYKKYEKSFDK